MRRRYHVLNVFTETKLAGNPLAVLLDCDGLDDTAMQAIAREFNLAETVFAFPPRDAINMARLRIFTPARELPFAGHPTIGTAVLLALTKAPDLVSREEIGLVLEEEIGAIRCTVRHRKGEAPHARFEVARLAEPCGAPLAASDLAGMLGLAFEDVGFDDHAPTFVSAGNKFHFVPIASLDALGRARPSLLDATVPVGFYLYSPVAGTQPRTFRSRMFAPGFGASEDPATGSAAAAFPGALLANEPMPDGAYDCFLNQGIEMGRPSRIGIAFHVDGGRLASTTIGGSAVVVAEGVLDF